MLVLTLLLQTAALSSLKIFLGSSLSSHNIQLQPNQALRCLSSTQQANLQTAIMSLAAESEATGILSLKMSLPKYLNAERGEILPIEMPALNVLTTINTRTLTVIVTRK